MKLGKDCLASTQTCNIANKCITVIEHNTKSVLRDRHNDNGVAFAQCISGDFGNEKQMTAVVAIRFKNEVRKPSI